MADGEDTLITVDALTVEEARKEVLAHQRIFYGPGDGAGRALAVRRPDATIVAVHEAKLLAEWGQA